MRTHDNQDYDSKTLPSTKIGRFRLPFKQKPVVGMGSPPSSSSTTPSPYNLFNFSRKLSGPKVPSAQPRKSVSFSGMDWKRKMSSTDHTDVAYREAVTRLRTMLSPRPHNLLDSISVKGSSVDLSSPTHKALDLATPSPPQSSARDRFSFRSMFSRSSPPKSLNNQLYPYNAASEDDLFDFINKQGEYIAQLEKETKYCRDDLCNMLDKVRDVISENEALHDRQKREMLNNMIDQLDEKTDGYKFDSYKRESRDKLGNSSNNPGTLKKSIIKKDPSNVIMESRIAEMEAQLSQAKRNLSLAQQEISELRSKRNLDYGQFLEDSSSGTNNPYAHCDLHRAEIENLTREKQDLLETLSKFKQLMSELRDRENDAAKKVKKSLDTVESMQEEKAQSDLETRRLRDELERHQHRLRELISDNCKKLHEEKLQVELKYRQEIEMLNSNINSEIDSLTRTRLDLERMKRSEMELKRELQIKSQTIDDLRQENMTRMGHMQRELSQALVMKSQAEQELINTRLQVEKAERDGKNEAAKLQAEITCLRERMESSDDELLKTQEIIIQLNETIAHLQRENTMLKQRDGATEEPDVANIIQNMEEKHSRDMSDLENLIQAQNALLDNLRGECKTLTDKLEDNSKQYRQDLKVELQSCVSTLRQDNADHNQQQQQQKQPPVEPEKVKSLLSELETIVQEMTTWLETHMEEESDEEDEEEEESEEEDDEEEDAEGEEKEKAEGEAAEVKKEEEEKEKEEGEKSEKEDAEKKEESENPEKPEEKTTPERKNSGEKEKEGESEKEKEESEKEPEKEEKEKKKPEPEAEPEHEEKEVKEKKKKDTHESKAKDAEKDHKEKEAHAAAIVVEMNTRLEEWIHRIQSVIQRFSSYFPAKAAC